MNIFLFLIESNSKCTTGVPFDCGNRKNQATAQTVLRGNLGLFMGMKVALDRTNGSCWAPNLGSLLYWIQTLGANGFCTLRSDKHKVFFLKLAHTLFSSLWTNKIAIQQSCYITWEGIKPDMVDPGPERNQLGQAHVLSYYKNEEQN